MKKNRLIFRGVWASAAVCAVLISSAPARAGGGMEGSVHLQVENLSNSIGKVFNSDTLGAPEYAALSGALSDLGKLNLKSGDPALEPVARAVQSAAQRFTEEKVTPGAVEKQSRGLQQANAEKLALLDGVFSQYLLGAQQAGVERAARIYREKLSAADQAAVKQRIADISAALGQSPELGGLNGAIRPDNTLYAFSPGEKEPHGQYQGSMPGLTLSQEKGAGQQRHDQKIADFIVAKAAANAAEKKELKRRRQEAEKDARVKASEEWKQAMIKENLDLALKKAGVNPGEIIGWKLVKDWGLARENNVYDQEWAAWTQDKGYKIEISAYQNDMMGTKALKTRNVEEVDLPQGLVSPAPPAAETNPAAPLGSTIGKAGNKNSWRAKLSGMMPVIAIGSLMGLIMFSLAIAMGLGSVASMPYVIPISMGVIAACLVGIAVILSRI